jgi:LysM repeat protein
MARRTKSKQRRETRSDPLEALRPLVVLGLLGMILYGAYSIIQKGPSRDGPNWQASETAGEPPAFTGTQAAPPEVELSGPAAPPATVATATAAPPPQPAPAPVAAIAPAQSVTPPATSQSAVENSQPVAAAAEMPPTYIEAVAAVPPKPAPAAIPQQISPPASNDSVAFTAAWADAHDKLESGRYAEALAILSVWYDDISLSPEEGRQLETLLGQLAGTVIYSTQDLLLPPHIVAAGETLEGIARPLEVPAALLANINGLGPDGPQPGQPLKVVRGPFDAVVSVSRRRLSLQVGGRYAGSFAAAIGGGFTARSGSSVRLVEIQRKAEPTNDGQAVPVAYQMRQGPAILLSDGLRIEPANDPGFVAVTPAESVLLVSAADFADLADILGGGSQLLIRQ